MWCYPYTPLREILDDKEKQRHELLLRLLAQRLTVNALSLIPSLSYPPTLPLDHCWKVTYHVWHKVSLPLPLSLPPPVT